MTFRVKFLNQVRGRFSRGLFWNIVSTLFTQGSTFLTSMILARLLGVDIYGEFSMVLSTLLTVTGIAQVSTGLTVTKYVAEFRDTDKVRAGRILGLCLMLTLVMGIAASVFLLLCAPWISERIMVAPHLEASLVLAIPFVLFSVMNAYQVGGLAGLESYKQISIYSSLLGVLYLAMCSAGAFFGGLNGALLGIVSIAILRWATYAVILRREAKKHQILLELSHWTEERGAIIRFALPASLAGLSYMPAIWMSNAFLVQQANGFFEMGIYAATLNLKILFLLLPSLINGVATSILNNNKGLGDKKLFDRTFFVTIQITLVTSLFGAMIMFLGGEFLIRRTFGEAYLYEGTKFLISIMAVQVIIEAIGIAVYQIIQAQEKMWKSLFYIVIPRDATIVVLAYILIPIYGAIGLAASLLIGFFFALLMKIFIAYKLKAASCKEFR